MFEANWDVARLGAAQNFVDIVGRRAGTGPESPEISPVTAKPTRGGAAQRGIPCARGDVETGCLDGAGWIGYLIAGFIGACILIAIARAFSSGLQPRT